MLISPLNSFPWVINGLVQANVSFKRLREFLNLKNLNWLTYYSYHRLIQNECIIEIKNAGFKWKEENSLVLSGINLEINRNQLIGVIGKVGCGKTSFLHALMSEVYICLHIFFQINFQNLVLINLRLQNLLVK